MITSPLASLNNSEKGFSKTYTCDKCLRQFKQKTRYERHILNHPNESSYLCSTCNKTFTRIAHLEVHLRTHSDERSHVCNICGAAFILLHHLERHKMIHNGVRAYECEICKKQFTRKAGLVQHEYVHTGKRPFVCDHKNCGKTYSDKTTLRRHILTHTHEKPFICKECNKTFRTKAACRKHYIRHFSPLKSFKCGICEEMFNSHDLLVTHLNVHKSNGADKNLRCGFCMRVFKTHDDLNAHTPSHDSVLFNQCSKCHLKFYKNYELDQHVIETHADNDKSDDNSKLHHPLCNGKLIVLLHLDNKDMNSVEQGEIPDLTDAEKSPSLSRELSQDQQQDIQSVLQQIVQSSTQISSGDYEDNQHVIVQPKVSLTSSMTSRNLNHSVFHSKNLADRGVLFINTIPVPSPTLHKGYEKIQSCTTPFSELSEMSMEQGGEMLLPTTTAIINQNLL